MFSQELKNIRSYFKTQEGDSCLYVGAIVYLIYRQEREIERERDGEGREEQNREGEESLEGNERRKERKRGER